MRRRRRFAANPGGSRYARCRREPGLSFCGKAAVNAANGHAREHGATGTAGAGAARRVPGLPPCRRCALPSERGGLDQADALHQLSPKRCVPLPGEAGSGAAASTRFKRHQSTVSTLWCVLFLCFPQVTVCVQLKSISC